jgi:hypoxanthine phosphoribosyltransferase
MADALPAGARLVASAAAVRDAWDRLAAGVQSCVDREPCVLLGVLLGGMVPLVNIASRIRGDFLLDYCHLTRYRGELRGGRLEWLQRPHCEMRERTVVVIDDVFDEGHTLREIRQHCLAAGADRVVIAVLIHKRHGHAVPGMLPDLVGIEAGDEYLFGCGMDYRERWRHLDAIWALSGGENDR